MPTFAHVHGDDPIGLADEDTIILTDVRGGPRNQYVEVFAANAAYIAAAAQAIKPISEFQIDYELLADASLVLPIGALIGTGNLIITGINAQCGADKYPTVSVTALKLSDPTNMYLVTESADITIVGGFGMVNVFGATGAGATGKGISSSLAVSMQTAEAMHPTSGDFLAEDSYTHYGLKQECSLETYDVITIPTGAKLVSEDTKTGRTGWKTYAKSWFVYL